MESMNDVPPLEISGGSIRVVRERFDFDRRGQHKPNPSIPLEEIIRPQRFATPASIAALVIRQAKHLGL